MCLYKIRKISICQRVKKNKENQNKNINVEDNDTEKKTELTNRGGNRFYILASPVSVKDNILANLIKREKKTLKIGKGDVIYMMETLDKKIQKQKIWTFFADKCK